MALFIFIGIVTFCYIMGLCQIYGYRHFKSLQNRLVIIEKRYPSLVLMEAVICCIYLFLGVPIWVFFRLDTEFNLGHELGIGAVRDVLYYGGPILNIYCSHFMVETEACRLWLISFDLHYLNSSKNEQWKSQIDASFADKDWYLRNRTKWGNKRFVFRRAAAYFVTAATITATNDTVSKTVAPELVFLSTMIDSLLFLVPLFFIVYSYWKCPKQLDDQFLYHFEFKTTTIVFVATFFMYFRSTFLKFHLFAFNDQHRSQ